MQVILFCLYGDCYYVLHGQGMPYCNMDMALKFYCLYGTSVFRIHVKRVISHRVTMTFLWDGL